MKTKTTTKILSALLAVVMLLSAVLMNRLDLFRTTVSAESATIIDYKLYEGYLTFNGTAAMVNYNSENPSPFSGNSTITSAYIPQGVTSIGQKTFVNCSKLQRITIPGSVTRIEANAFSGTTVIQDICYYGTTESWNKIVIEGGNSGLQNTRITCTNDAEWDNGYTEYHWEQLYYDRLNMYPAVPSDCAHRGWPGPNYIVRSSCQFDIEITDWCYECNQEVTMIFPRTPHCFRIEEVNYDHHEETCLHETQYYMECLSCGMNGYFTKPPINHEWQCYDCHEATCTQDGYDEYTCYMCDETYRDNIVPAIGHNYQWYTEYSATCTHDGLMRYCCSNCGDIVEEKIIPTTGHNVVTDTAVEPTCTTTGLTEGSHCSECGGEIYCTRNDTLNRSYLWCLEYFYSCNIRERGS